MTSQRTVEAAQRRIALVVAYEGTQYAGFQLQADVPTIQGELERAFNRLTGERARVRGASRTDSGAHAICQVVDLTTGATHGTNVVVAAMNHYLQGDIRVLMASDVPEAFQIGRAHV